MQAGTDALINVTDHTTNAAVTAVREAHNSLNATAQAALNVEGKSFNVLMDEVETLREQYIDSLRKIANAVTGAANES